METFKIDDVTFTIDTRAGKDRAVSKRNNFVLVKNERCLDFYRKWKGPKPKTIMEVGMFEGGSLVLMDKLLKPKTIVGLDIRREPIKPLEAYAKKNPHMKTYYARSQDKAGTLMAARQNFPKGIDLIIDDASHLYDQTRATFEMLFPLVTKGGKYVIEDWAWAHSPNHQAKDATWYDRTAMSNLILKLTVLAARYGVIDKLEVYKEYVCITKGEGILPDNALDLDGMLRGRTLDLI